MEKVSLYKFTHIPLLKIDGQLKPKNDKQPKIKRGATSPKTAHTHARARTHTEDKLPCASAHWYFCPLNSLAIYFPSFPLNQTHSKKFSFLFSFQIFLSTLFQLQANTPKTFIFLKIEKFS